MTATDMTLEQTTGPLWTLRYILLMLANFFTCIVHFSLLTLLPLYAVKVGGTNTQVGLLTGLYSLAALAFRPVFGRMLDRSGRKPVLILGLALVTLSTATYIFTHSIVVLLAFRILSGVGFSAGSTAIATVVADILPGRRLAEGIGYFGLSSTFAQAVGPLTGLYIIQSFGYRTLFMALVAMSVVSMLFVWVIKYPPRPVLAADSHSTAPPAQKSYGFLEASLIWPALILLLVVTASGAVMTFVANYAFSLGITNIGMFFTVVSAGTIISRLVFGKLTLRFSLGHILVLSMVAVIFSQLILGIAAGFWLFLVAAAFFGLGIGWVVPIINTVIVLFASPDRKGAALSVHYSAMDIGIGASSIIWGVVSGHYGYAVIYELSALCCVAALMIYFFTLRGRLG